MLAEFRLLIRGEYLLWQNVDLTVVGCDQQQGTLTILRGQAAQELLGEQVTHNIELGFPQIGLQSVGVGKGVDSAPVGGDEGPASVRFRKHVAQMHPQVAGKNVAPPVLDSPIEHGREAGAVESCVVHSARADAPGSQARGEAGDRQQCRGIEAPVEQLIGLARPDWTQ